jgi:hypothetical protein
MVGMATSLVFMILIWAKTPLAWTWYVLLGTIVCTSVGYGVSMFWEAEDVSVVREEERV